MVNLNFNSMDANITGSVNLDAVGHEPKVSWLNRARIYYKFDEIISLGLTESGIATYDCKRGTLTKRVYVTAMMDEMQAFESAKKHFDLCDYQRKNAEAQNGAVVAHKCSHPATEPINDRDQFAAEMLKLLFFLDYLPERAEGQTWGELLLELDRQAKERNRIKPPPTENVCRSSEP